MSTRSTIKYERDENSGAGFHLFEDVLDDNPDNEATVYLELFHVPMVNVLCCHGNCVEVEIPREWARKLGMLPGKVMRGE